MRLLLPPERAKRGIIRETCLIIRVEFLFACIWRNIWRHRGPFEYSKKWIFSQTVCTLCEEKTWRLKNGKHIRVSNYSDFDFVCKVIYNYTKGIRKKIFESVIDPLLRKKKKERKVLPDLPLSNDEEQRFQISGNKKLLNLIPDGSIGWNSRERNGKCRIRVPSQRFFPGGTKRGEISLADSRQTFLSPFFFIFFSCPLSAIKKNVRKRRK